MGKKGGDLAAKNIAAPALVHRFYSLDGARGIFHYFFFFTLTLPRSVARQTAYYTLTVFLNPPRRVRLAEGGTSIFIIPQSFSPFVT